MAKEWKSDRLDGETVTSSRKVMSGEEIAKKNTLLVILIAIILINALIGYKTFKVSVKDGEVVREGEKPIQLISVIQYVQNTPQIDLNNIRNQIKLLATNAKKANTANNATILNAIVSTWEQVAKIATYIATPFVLIINGLIICVYFVGILFI